VVEKVAIPIETVNSSTKANEAIFLVLRFRIFLFSPYDICGKNTLTINALAQALCIRAFRLYNEAESGY